MGGAILATRGLVKRFGGFLATDHVDFSVGAGEVRGIIGPNGAGKTTLVNLMTGIHVPDAGEIRLDDRSLVGVKPGEIARRGLVRSFQVSRIFGNLDLVENLMVPWLAEAKGGGAQAQGLEKARTFLDLTKLARLAKEPAKSLSGGQRVLLQVAAGFMSPSLRCYVLDEPFAGINPVIKDLIIELIEHENRSRAMTFVIVSHEMAVMRRLCTSITVMIQGRIIAEGPLDEVAARPDVIAAYLGKGLA